MTYLDTGDQADRGAFVLGLGCERGAECDEVIALAERALATAGVHRKELRCVASLDVRAAEPAILAAAMHLGVSFRVFDAATLEAETARLPNPSKIVFALSGCHGVAEAAALAAAEKGGYLIVPKMKSAKATAAVAVGFFDRVQRLGSMCSNGDSASSGDDSSFGFPAAASFGIAS